MRENCTRGLALNVVDSEALTLGFPAFLLILSIAAAHETALPQSISGRYPALVRVTNNEGSLTPGSVTPVSAYSDE